MVIKIFGRQGCVPTRTLIRKLRLWLNKTLGEGADWVEFVDLETPAGLAEAAFLQLEGAGPSIVVEAGPYREAVREVLKQARVSTRVAVPANRETGYFPSLN